MNKRKLLVAAMAACSALLASGTRAGEYSMSVDGEATRGDYGLESSSTVSSLTLGLQYQGDRFNWAIAVPWVVVQAPPGVVVSGGMMQSGGRFGSAAGGGGMGGMGSTSTTRTDSGVGDATASAGYALVEGEAGFLGVTGKVKFATGDETRGLGSGANDYFVQLEAARGWVNGRVGYRWIGNSDSTNYNNVAYGALGLSYRFESGTETGVEYFGEQAVADGGEPRRELTLFASHPLDKGKRVRGYLLKGFSDASPDVGAGLGIVFDL